MDDNMARLKQIKEGSHAVKDQPQKTSNIERIKAIPTKTTTMQTAEAKPPQTGDTPLVSFANKLIQGAIEGAALTQINRILAVDYEKGPEGKLTPAGLGNMIKDIARLGIDIPSSPSDAVVGGVLKSTGLGEAVGGLLSKVPKTSIPIPPTSPLGIAGIAMTGEVPTIPLNEAVTTGVELASLLPGIPRITSKGNVPIPDNIQPFKTVGEKIKEGGKVTTEDLQLSMAKQGEAAFETMRKDVYQPIREAVNTVKVPKNIGKQITAKIKQDLQLAQKNKDITIDDLNKAEKMLADIDDVTDIDKAIKARTLFREKAGEIYKDNLKAGDKVKQLVYESMTDNIRSYIKDPALLKKFNVANRVYKAFIDDGIELKKFYDKVGKDIDTAFEKEILKGSTVSIMSARKQLGGDMVAAGGYNYLNGKVFDDAGFNAKSFRKTIEGINDKKGALIFGEDWKTLKKMSDELKPSAIEAQVTGWVPVVDKYINVFGKWRDLTKQNLYFNPEGKGVANFIKFSAVKEGGDTAIMEEKAVRNVDNYMPKSGKTGKYKEVK